MTKNVNVQYVGFKADSIERKYSFIVRRALNEISEFTITIGNEAFGPRRVRFQDAPEICSMRLHRELDTFEDHPPQSSYRISEMDLDDFITSHPSSRGHLHKPKTSPDQ
jgi:hypothetical protein